MGVDSMIMTIDEVKEAIKETTVDKYQIGDTAYVIEKAEEGWLLKVMIFGKCLYELDENTRCDYFVLEVGYGYTRRSAENNNKFIQIDGFGVDMGADYQKYDSGELIDEESAKKLVAKYEKYSAEADENRRKKNNHYIVVGGEK